MENTLSIKEQALELHKSILYNYRMAAHHLVEAARGLKEMRDTKAYTSLGMATFEEYTEQMAGIKARQAYTYISTLERLGQPLMEEQAGLGITKLSLLAEITPMERADFAAEHDLHGMTVKEVEALVAENNRRGEQLNLFAQEREKTAQELEAQQEALRRLKEELEEERSRPPKVEQVTVAQPTEEQLAELRMTIQKELQAENAKTVKALEAEQAEKLKKAKSAAEDKLARAEDARKQAEETVRATGEQLRQLQKQLEEERAAQKQQEKAAQMAADGDYRALDIYFAQLQEAANRILQLIATLRESDPEKATRTGAALAKYFEAMGKKVQA